MFEDLMNEIEGMTEEQKQELLAIQFPEKLQKQANAQIDTGLLADALYTYGWLQAERNVAEEVGLDKVASADLEAHEAAEKECGEQIEACLEALQIHNEEDSAELHKEAQVAAALIFDGFSDRMEEFSKEAAWHKALVEGAKKHVDALAEKAKAHAGAMGAKAKALGIRIKEEAATHSHADKVKKGLAGAAVAAGAYGAYRGAKHLMKKDEMSKQSSELSVGELIELTSEAVMEKQAMESVVFGGIEKLAKKGEEKGKKMKEMFAKASKSSSKSSKSSK